MENLINEVKARLDDYSARADSARDARIARMGEVVNLNNDLPPTKDRLGVYHAPADNYYWEWSVIDEDGFAIATFDGTYMAGEFLPWDKSDRSASRMPSRSSDFGKRVKLVPVDHALALISGLQDTARVSVSSGKHFERDGKMVCHIYVKTNCDDVVGMIEDAIYASQDSEKKAENDDAEDVVEGKQLIAGTILSTKEVEGYAYNQMVLKMLVRDDRGFKVWGSVPASIYADAEKGTRIQFNASVQASNDDPKFGFFKRPTKAVTI